MAEQFTTITLATPSIDTTAFKTLVSDLLEELVYGSTSPFKEAKNVLEDYLDGATDLDATQKAGVLSGFLKDTYTQVNQQVMATALDLLKTNEQLALEKYTTEAQYNVQMETKARIAAETDKISKDALTSVTQETLVKAQADNEVTKALEMVAKLHKQYGYGSATATTLGDSTGTGSIDKQIDGFDKVNYKDALKAVNESLALTTNAGVVPGQWVFDSAKILLEMVTDGKLDLTGGTVQDTTNADSQETFTGTSATYNAIATGPNGL